MRTGVPRGERADRAVVAAVIVAVASAGACGRSRRSSAAVGAAVAVVAALVVGGCAEPTKPIEVGLGGPAQAAPPPSTSVAPAYAPLSAEHRQEFERQESERFSTGSYAAITKAIAKAGRRIESGIEGEPVPMDTRDLRYKDFFVQIRNKIRERWRFPCVKVGEACEYKNTELEVELGVAKDGRLLYVRVLRESPYATYNDSALNAIRLASPFPPVPDALLQGKGLPITIRFTYVVDSKFEKGAVK